jgi:hypothetical protein
MTAVVKLLVDRLPDELQEICREALPVHIMVQITVFMNSVGPRLQHPATHEY